MARSHLTRFGTAARAVAPADPVDAWVERLAGGVARAYEVDPALVDLAFEVATWQGGLDADERRALVLLVTASLLARARGSTRVAVLGEAGRAALRDLLGPILPAEGDAPADAGAWVARVEALVAGGRLGDVLARVSGGGGTARASAVGAAPGSGRSGLAALGEEAEGSGVRPLVLDGPWLYPDKLHAGEASLARALAARARAPAAPELAAGDVEAALRDVLARPSGGPSGAVVLAPEQERAVRVAAGGPLAVVSGGPGTGKTSVVVALVRVLARLGVGAADVALAAPTGKAAARLAEATVAALASIADPAPADEALRARPPQAVTLHRLLAYSPGRGAFLRGPTDPVEERVVVVDEASMVDLLLMARLARALRAGARLVLLGDPDQLPAVGSGSVLRDLVAAPGPSSVHLARGFRVHAGTPGGDAVLALGRAVREGRVEAVRASLAVRASAGALRFEGAEALLGAGVVPDLLARWHGDRLAPLERLAARTFRVGDGAVAQDDVPDARALHEALASARLLSVTRAGADAVNRTLHKLRLAARGRDEHFDLLAGEPVLVLRNDHERGLSNGDVGVVVWASCDGARPRPCAAFPRGDGLRAWHLELLRDRLSLCYGMTVHKAQGSELDTAVLLLPREALPLLTREVVYTAVTRARRSVLVAGREDVLAAGVSRVVTRSSGLAERLARA